MHADEFWRHVSIPSAEGCWEWQRSKARGYGVVWLDSRQRVASRVAYEIHHGPIPAGYHVCHRCDNPPCCNPAHLFAAPPAGNLTDAAIKGRLARRVTPEQAAEIRRSAGAGEETKAIAERLGLPAHSVRSVARGAAHKLCPEPAVPPRYRRFGMTPEKRAEGARLVASGLTLGAAGARLGVSKAALSRALRGETACANRPASSAS